MKGALLVIGLCALFVHRSSAFAESFGYDDITESCLPAPVAFTGDEKTIRAGDSIRLGGMPLPHSLYRWSPTDALDDPDTAMPLATPTQDTEYTLRVTNGCGTAENKVRVRVTF